MSYGQPPDTPHVLTTMPSSMSMLSTSFPTSSTTSEATTALLESTNGGGTEATVTDSSTKTKTIPIRPSICLHTSSSPISSSSRKTTSLATIAGNVIGLFAAVFVLALLFILWRRRKYRSKVGNNADEEIDDPTTTVPNSNPVLRSSSASVRTVSISTINSLTSDLPRRLSQSSRNAYEEEIERLRQEVLSRDNHIRYMYEQMELTYNSSPPPSYRSSRRRSDVSEPFVYSSTLPPPLPTREIPS